MKPNADIIAVMWITPGTSTLRSAPRMPPAAAVVVAPHLAVQVPGHEGDRVLLELHEQARGRAFRRAGPRAARGDGFRQGGGLVHRLVDLIGQVGLEGRANLGVLDVDGQQHLLAVALLGRAARHVPHAAVDAVTLEVTAQPRRQGVEGQVCLVAQVVGQHHGRGDLAAFGPPVQEVQLVELVHQA